MVETFWVMTVSLMKTMEKSQMITVALNQVIDGQVLRFAVLKPWCFCSETQVIIWSPAGMQPGNSSGFSGYFHHNTYNPAFETQKQSELQILQKDTKIFLEASILFGY